MEEMKMTLIVENYDAQDLTKLKIKNVDDLNNAKFSIYAQITKWLIDNEESTSNLHSILLNKLYYYIASEVKNINKDFVINSGWYIYGPCFEEGRLLEKNKTPITIQWVAKDVSDEVNNVCKELIPKFRSCERKGTVLDEFLRYIYEHKCDQHNFKKFYLAKHEIVSILYRFNSEYHDISRENAMDINRITRNYERIFYEDDYKKLVETYKIRLYLSKDDYFNLISDLSNVNPNNNLIQLSSSVYTFTEFDFEKENIGENLFKVDLILYRNPQIITQWA